MNLQNFTLAPHRYNKRRNQKASKLKRIGWIAAFIVSSVITITAPPAKAEWSIDLSRRQHSVRDQDLNDFDQPDFSRTDGLENRSSTQSQDASADADEGSGRSPASARSAWDNSGAALDPASGPTRKIRAVEVAASPLTKVLKKLVQVSEPGQEIVILQTEKGFVPDTVRMRKDARYTVHVVNVNEKEKNVSFILDAFSEHHATYFGKVRTFTLEPKKDGVYSFQSPETAAEGRLIVYTQEPQVREPASATKPTALSGLREQESGLK